MSSTVNMTDLADIMIGNVLDEVGNVGNSTMTSLLGSISAGSSVANSPLQTRNVAEASQSIPPSASSSSAMLKVYYHLPISYIIFLK